MVAFAIITTIFAGTVGAFLGGMIAFSNLGIIVAIAVMGGFIISELKERNER